MLSGFKIFICGTSKITNTHIKVLKKFRNCKVDFIYGKDKSREAYLSKKFDISICESLADSKIKNCNLAIVTNSTKDHLNSIETLSKSIKNFIVEKPLVKNSEELKKLHKLQIENKLSIQEVSQNIFNPIIQKNINKVSDLKIFVKKKRTNQYYKDSVGNYDFNKNAVSSQLPHWIDVAEQLIGSNLKILKISKNKSSENIPFNDKILVKFINDQEKKCTIEVNFSSNENHPTEIYLSGKKYELNEKNPKKMIINYFNKFLPKLYLLNYQEKAFYHMYDFYLNNLINGVNDVKKKYSRKFEILDNLNY